MGQLITEQKKQLEEVDSLFVQLDCCTWLMPMSAVAEVVKYVEYDQSSDGPAWLAGWIEWREQRVPLVSFGALAGNGSYPVTKDAPVLVMNTLEPSAKFQFYAIAIKGFPHSVRISEESLLQEMRTTVDMPYALMEVELGGRKAMIPDLKCLEQHLLENL